MKYQEDSLLSAILTVYQIEEFGRKLSHELPRLKKSVKVGEDITPLLIEMKVDIPEELRGEALLWLDEESEHTIDQKSQTLSFVGAGNPKALGITIGCIRPKGKEWRYCLECSWWSCRTVIVLDPIIVVTPQPS